MCNVLEKLNAIIPYIQGEYLNNLYPPEFINNWAYNSVNPYRCISCSRRMTNNEMFPSNRATPRAVCKVCYDKWQFFIIRTERCRVCGDYLEKWRLDRFKANSQEISNRLHDGRCLDYFCLLSGKALGSDMSFLMDEMYSHPLQYTDAEYWGYTNNPAPHDYQDCIDVPYMEVARQQGQIRRIPGPSQRALPLPHEQFRIPDQHKKLDDEVPVSRIYKGKRVVTVDKYGKKRR
jgi:hypothetical protein